MSSRIKRVWLYIILIMVALCVTGAAVSLTKIPTVDQQISANSSRLAVRIITPRNESHWQIGMPIPVSITAIGDQQIQSMELWVDSKLTQSKDATNGSALLSWTINSLGEHTLLVRAKDSGGNISSSNAVRVIGIEPNLTGLYVDYKAKTGDTVTSLAASYGTTPKAILGMNPNLNPTSPLPNGSEVKIPEISAMPPAPAPPQPTSGNGGSPAPTTPVQKPAFITPNPLPFWVSKFTQQNAPSAPSLSLNANTCSVNVLITNTAKNAFGLYVYRLDPNDQTFHRITTLAPNSNGTTPIEYTDPKLYGSFSYYVSAFNAHGETPSAPSEIQIADATCKTGYWAGLDLQPSINPVLSAKYDKAYFYLHVNNQNWGRVPQDPTQFLPLNNGLFEVSDQINAYLKPPAQGEETIELDAWGWQGGNLVHIGDFTRTLSAQAPSGSPAQTFANPKPSLVQLEWCGQQLTILCLDTPAKFGAYSKVTFQWTAPPNTYGIYQVWSFPLGPSQDCPVNDPGVLSSGIIGEQNGSNKFTIDFTKLTSGTQFYVRVLALNMNGASACEPSNAVSVTFNPPPAGQMPDPYIISIASIDPGLLPNASKPGCVTITKNDLYKPQPPGFDYQQWIDTETVNLEAKYGDAAEWVARWEPWPVGTELCPPAYVPPADPCANSLSLSCAEWLGTASVHQFEGWIDQASAYYAAAKNYVVSGIVNIIPGCKDDTTCNNVVKDAVNAGLAYLGLPPALPNASTLEKQGLSYAADQMFDEYGVSCTDLSDKCQQLLNWGHDKAVQAIENTLTEQQQQNQINQMAANCISEDDAHAEGIQYAMCVPPEVANLVQFVPAPDSAGSPTILTLKIARNGTVPDSALPDSYSCSIKLHSSAKNDSWVGQQVFIDGNQNLPWTGTELTDNDDYGYSGLFYDVSQSIPHDLSFPVAESSNELSGVQIPIPLTPRSNPFPQLGGFWIVDHWNYDTNILQQDAIGDPDDWPMLYRGADATFTVTESCSSSAGSFTDTPKDQQTIHINK